MTFDEVPEFNAMSISSNAIADEGDHIVASSVLPTASETNDTKSGETTNKTASASVSSPSDKELIGHADNLISEECLLAAFRLLQQVKDSSVLTSEHEQVVRNAVDMEASSADLLQEPDSSWTKQSETKSSSTDGDTKQKRKRDTTLYYKVDGARLECRIDCIMESSLLVPFLSVLNETSLYQTWIPSWTVPVTLGIRESKHLKQVSRGHQIVHISCNVPWPVSTRDVVLRASACDDIEANSAIVVRMKGIQTGEDECVPEVLSSVVRADFEGAILIRPCPQAKLDQSNKQEESKVLVSFKMFMDPQLSAIPISIINFVTRTVILTMWNMLLQVAEGVREGNRPLHAKAISEKPSLYKWIEDRIQVLLGQMDQP